MSDKTYRISHNQLKVWWDCPTKWVYSYDQNLAPVDTKEYYTSGLLLHDLLEVYGNLLKQGIPPGDKNAFQSVMEYAARDVQTHVAIEDMTLFNNVLRVVARYIKEFSFIEDSQEQIILVEHEFEVPMETPAGRQIVLNGRIDQIRKDAAGGYWAMDFKSSMAGHHWTQDSLLFDSQQSTYAAVLKKLGFPLTGVMVDSMSTYGYKDFWKEPLNKIYKRVRCHRTDRELEANLRNYLTAVDAQQDLLESDKEIPMHLTKECVRCAFKEICLYRVKGIDTEFLIAQNFKEKDDTRAIGLGGGTGFSSSPA